MALVEQKRDEDRTGKNRNRKFDKSLSEKVKKELMEHDYRYTLQKLIKCVLKVL